MEFITPKEKILGAALIAERLVGKKETLPVLSCIYLDASAGSLTLQATNLEAGVRLRVLGDVRSPGFLAIPASVFTQTLRSVAGEKVALRAEGGNLVVESRGSKTLIKSVNAEEFPSIAASPDDVHGVSVSRSSLIGGIESVMYAASPSMIRPELGSVCVSIEEGSITCVATDSFRLAEKTLRHGGDGDERTILVPMRHAGELIHVLERIDDENIELIVEDSQLTVRSDSVVFVSRVVDGRFPNYKEIVPKSYVTEATVLKSDLADLLRKARVFSGTEQRIGLHLYPGKKIFSGTAQSQDVGEMSDTLEAALSGDDLDIFFNIGYIADCLSSIESDSVVLRFAGPGRPLVIRGVSDQSFMYLVMPLNR